MTRSIRRRPFRCIILRRRVPGRWTATSGGRKGSGRSPLAAVRALERTLVGEKQ